MKYKNLFFYVLTTITFSLIVTPARAGQNVAVEVHPNSDGSSTVTNTNLDGSGNPESVTQSATTDSNGSVNQSLPAVNQHPVWAGAFSGPGLPQTGTCDDPETIGSQLTFWLEDAATHQDLLTNGIVTNLSMGPVGHGEYLTIMSPIGCSSPTVIQFYAHCVDSLGADTAGPLSTINCP